MAPSEKLLSAQIGDLNTAINAAACDVNRWDDVAKLLQVLVPGSKILFQVVGSDNPAVHQVVHSGFADKTMQAYAEYFWQVNPWVGGMSRMDLSSFKTSSELYPEKFFRETEFYMDLVKPEQDCNSATALKFAAHHERNAFLCVHYDSRYSRELHSRSQTLLNTLVPSLRTALELNRLTNPGFDLSGGRGLIDQLVDAAMIVDQNCRLLASNAPANRLLADATFMLPKAKDVVEIKNMEANAAFVRLVKHSCSISQDRARQDDLAVDTPSGSYTVTCVPIALNETSAVPAGLLSIFAPKMAALAIVRPYPTRDLMGSADKLRRDFGLTKAEAGLILEFGRGGTLSEIADRVGVSRSTVQTHLKSIFAKTGTSKQRDVVTLVTQHAAASRRFSISD
jgi:DNA-binding CsgD family transcriptional regulator